ncbi:MAG: pyridoxamine 5'-phosphate oxidase family protein [Candidatus Scalindua sp.]|nr:pyridoxamine 5'-phosphate oxidase family protein [Candidatus Scalindua sp.]
MSDVKTKIMEFLGSVKTVSVATCLNNRPSCRIMEIQKVEDNLKIWFVSHKSSPKEEQIHQNSNACIVSFNSEISTDIRLYGTFEIYDDMETKKSIWKDELAPYFEGGVNDPEFNVLKFVPERLEFRDMNKGSLLPEVEICKKGV